MSGNGKQLCRCACHWDLSWLRFGDTRISFGDVDGLFVVERRGYFIYIETKGPDEKLPTGQRILLDSLRKVPRFTVLLVRGPKGYPATVQHLNSKGWGDEEPTNRHDFQARMNRWFEMANSKQCKPERAQPRFASTFAQSTIDAVRELGDFDTLEYLRRRIGQPDAT